MKNKGTCILFLMLMVPFALFSQFTVTSSVTDASCSYTNDGSISVSVSGGTTPYTYQWFPGGEASPSVSGLAVGTYTVLITDNLGIDSTVFFVVGPSAILNDTANKITAPFCTNNGSIVLNVSGGSGSYQYAWNTGSTNVFIAGLNEGDYSVVVTDANNCTTNFNFSLAGTKCFVEPAPYFTPNGDGWNDTWVIQNGEHFPEARLIVFDRWGTKVYERKGAYENWDGKSYLGVPVPDAVYYYFFYEDKDDKQKASKHGSVTIIR